MASREKFRYRDYDQDHDDDDNRERRRGSHNQHNDYGREARGRRQGADRPFDYRDDDGSQRSSYWGQGPEGYQRSDERILEDINDRLTWHGNLNATQILVTVTKGKVTLEGMVEDREQKRMA